VITYSPSQEVYEGTLVSITCVSQTKDPKNTKVSWIRSGDILAGEVVQGSASVTNTITLPALLSDSSARYDCHVDHENLPEALIDYARIKGRRRQAYNCSHTDTVLCQLVYLQTQ